MSAIELVLKQPWVARAGCMLVHFLWQGTLIAVLLAAVRGVAGRRIAPRARYAMACLALGLMTITPLATFLASGSPGASALPAPVWRASGGAAWERILPWLVVAWLCGAGGPTNDAGTPARPTGLALSGAGLLACLLGVARHGLVHC